MIQHPAILALMTASLIVSGLLLYAGWFGIRILKNWDLASGSELQLNLERRTYLIATIVSYALLFQTISLFLYLYTADGLHILFTGAMCAAGTLQVNSYGYPTLIMKLINCLLAGSWLIVNHADTRGYDYPLIKPKYVLLLGLVLLVLAETVLQFNYFMHLKGDMITSCCGSLFGSDKPSIAGELAGLPYRIMRPLFFSTMAVLACCGIRLYLKGSGGYLYAALSAFAFVVSLAALISFIGLYYYELPTHHCPFCILQQEYGYIGYLLYATLLGGMIAGSSIGLLMPFRASPSLAPYLPRLQQRLILLSLACYLLFTALVSYRMLTANFRLGG